MLFNRSLQVKMVKNAKEDTKPSSQSDITLEGKTAIIGYALKSTIETIGKAVIAYVAVDTVRQVMVARASK